MTTNRIRAFLASQCPDSPCLVLDRECEIAQAFALGVRLFAVEGFGRLPWPRVPRAQTCGQEP